MSVHALKIGDDPPPRGYSSAVQIVERLRKEGFSAYLVGGCVRDMWLGRRPTDFDIATDAHPQDIAALFAHTKAIGQAFGVMQVYLRGHPYEVATFRSDGIYHDGRRPVSVTYSNAEEDVKRRDFTINGLLFDPARQQIVDMVGGVSDLDAGLIRAIGDPLTRFEEDSLRLLRAVRFSARMGFDIEPDTEQAIKNCAPQLSRIAPERILGELELILTHPSRVRAVKKLVALGLWKTAAPELESARISQPQMWTESMDIVAALPDKTEFSIVMAALFTTTLSKAGTKKQLKLWRASNDICSSVIELLEQSLWWLTGDSDDRAGRIRHLRQESGWAHLKFLRARLKALGSANTAYRALKNELQALHAEDTIRGGAAKPPVDGNDLMRWGLTPGPELGQILWATEDAWLNGEVASAEETLRWLADLHPGLNLKLS